MSPEILRHQEEVAVYSVLSRDAKTRKFSEPNGEPDSDLGSHPFSAPETKALKADTREMLRYLTTDWWVMTGGWWGLVQK